MDNLEAVSKSGGFIKRPAVRRFVIDLFIFLVATVFSFFVTQQSLFLWFAVPIVLFGIALFVRFLEVFRMRCFPSSHPEWQVFSRLFLGVFGSSCIIALLLKFELSLAFGLLVSFTGVAGLLFDRFLRYRVSEPVAPVPGDPDRSVLKGKRVLIVGAGSAAGMLIEEMSRRIGQTTIVGLVDDDHYKVGSDVFGYRVIGKIADLEPIVKRERVTEVVIAIPSLSREGQKRILGLCEGINAQIKLMPSISRQLAESGQGLPVLRDVAPEELLQRDSIETDMSLASAYIKDQVILITGGGGSIGSELARQISTLRPKKIILFGKGENSIFETEMEFRQRGFHDVVPVIGGVRDRHAVDLVMSQYNPSVVFHAAAHKHVPLMERVPIEAVRNNIYGTQTVASLAIEHGVKKFILISTDKAVNPTNIMGATKRAAEMVILALAGTSQTQFAAVRFGNVLGSRGSLIPILKNQIAKGGPITITDERMTRFFMTIPEAAQLVIQAGAHGKGGEIFILDMGEPVKIVDVARGLLKLYGLEEGKDIEIVFIGARPGEKIHEELSWESEDLERIDSGKILRLRSPDKTEWSILSQQLEYLFQLCDQGKDEEVRAELMNLVKGNYGELPPLTNKFSGKVEPDIES